MIKDNIQHFFDKHSFDYVLTSSNEFCVKECPLCHDNRNKFYMSAETGLWHCKKCDESGNFYQLKAKLNDLDEISDLNTLVSNKYKPLDDSVVSEYIENLKKNKDAYDYLLKRGYTDDTIEHFKLGAEDTWIAIPHFQDKKLWNIKMRNYLNKEFKRVSGQPSILFNIDNIELNKSTLVIVEGETDCIAAWQMGIHNVVGLTTGAGTFAPEWTKWTQQFKTIYICLNSDDAGQKGAYKIAEKIGMKKCKNVILPTNDVNDYLTEKNPKDFLKEFNNSKKFVIKNISSISEYVDNIDEWFESEGSMKGLELQFPKINNHLKGFKSEDLIVLLGDTGVGKTTFILNILHNFLKNDHRCLGFFLEGKIMYYILRMMSIETQKEIDELNENDEKWAELKKKFLDFQMYFYSGAQMDLDTQKLTELLTAAIKTYDIEFVVIDNLQKFVKDDKEVVHQTSQAISVLKDLAVDLKIPIFVISHIRKPEKDRRKIIMHDAKSSSTIYQDADVFLILWNNKLMSSSEDDMMLTIAKNRMGEGGQDISIVYEKNIAVFREAIEGIDKKNLKCKITDVSKKEK